MKKIIAFVLLVIIALSVFGCAPKKPKENAPAAGSPISERTGETNNAASEGGE